MARATATLDERSETRDGDPAGFAGAVGGEANRGIDTGRLATASEGVS